MEQSAVKSLPIVKDEDQSKIPQNHVGRLLPKQIKTLELASSDKSNKRLPRVVHHLNSSSTIQSQNSVTYACVECKKTYIRMASLRGHVKEQHKQETNFKCKHHVKRKHTSIQRNISTNEPIPIKKYETLSSDKDREGHILKSAEVEIPFKVLPSNQSRIQAGQNRSKCNATVINQLLPTRSKSNQQNNFLQPKLHCQKCKSSFKSKYILLSHTKKCCPTKSSSKVEKISRLQCNQCDQKFTNRPSLFTHIQNICSKKLVSNLLSNLVRSDAQKNTTLKCFKCDELFLHKLSLERHMKLFCHIKSNTAVDKTSSNPKKVVAKSLKLKQTLAPANIVKITNRSTKLKCQYCDKIFSRKQSLFKHNKNDHKFETKSKVTKEAKEVTLNSSLCTVTLKNIEDAQKPNRKVNLKSSSPQSHAKITNPLLNILDKPTPIKDNDNGKKVQLQKHLEVKAIDHEEEDVTIVADAFNRVPVVQSNLGILCSKCSQTFSTFDNVVLHMTNCKPKRRLPYQCGHCKQSYSNVKLLQSHLTSFHMSKSEIIKPEVNRYTEK